MKPNFNKEIINIVIDDIFISLSHSNKSTDEFFRELVLQNPEMACSIKEWNGYSQEIKDNIIERIKDSLFTMQDRLL